MTAYARIITIGKNSEIPRFVRLPIGVHLDGSVVTATVQALADERVCPDCQGWGELRHSPINPSERDTWTECERCAGGGIIVVDENEEDISAGMRCLPAAGTGGSTPAMFVEPPTEQPAVPTVAASSSPASRLQSLAGLSSSSGNQPAAGASADLGCDNVQRSKKHPLQGVPRSSASQRPAGDLPPNGLPGTLERTLDTFTVIAGMIVFAAIAYFFLVLA